jgi:hypothetical protein
VAGADPTAAFPQARHRADLANAHQLTQIAIDWRATRSATRVRRRSMPTLGCSRPELAPDDVARARTPETA